MFPASFHMPALAGVLCLLAFTSPAQAGKWFKYDPSSGFSREYYPPSYWGYNLDERHPTYYGGSRYKEYYAYGRGYGYATFPEPFPEYPLGPYRGLPAVKIVPVPPGSCMPPCAAKLVLHVPKGADIWVDGQKTRQTGTVREFVTAPLRSGNPCTYEVRVRWKEAGQAVEATRDVVLRPGRRVQVKFESELELKDLPPDGETLASEEAEKKAEGE